MKTAFLDFQRKAVKSGRYNAKTDDILTEQWIRIIMHLPYAFQAKRMFPDVFRHDRRNEPMWKDVIAEIGEEPDRADFEDTPEGENEWDRAQDLYRRAISKTSHYQEFQNTRIEKAQRA